MIVLCSSTTADTQNNDILVSTHVNNAQIYSYLGSRTSNARLGPTQTTGPLQAFNRGRIFDMNLGCTTPSEYSKTLRILFCQPSGRSRIGRALHSTKDAQSLTYSCLPKSTQWYVFEVALVGPSPQCQRRFQRLE